MIYIIDSLSLALYTIEMSRRLRIVASPIRGFEKPLFGIKPNFGVKYHHLWRVVRAMRPRRDLMRPHETTFTTLLSKSRLFAFALRATMNQIIIITSNIKPIINLRNLASLCYRNPYPT